MHWLMFLFGFTVGAGLVFWWSSEKYEQAMDEAARAYIENAVLRWQMGQVATGADEYERAERGR